MIEIDSHPKVALLAIAGSLLASGAVAADLPAESATSRSRYLMGTICEVVVEADPDRADVAFDEIARVERLMSTWNDRSELSALNRSGGAVVSEETYSMLAEAMRLARATGGAFNPLVGPLVEVWQTRADGALPSASATARVLPLLSLAGPRFESATRRIDLLPGARFEEGGFGKGYALDRAAAALSATGAGEFLIDFGGQLLIRTRRPLEVAIADPERRDLPAVLLTMTSGSLSTSSGSEKSFVVDGERFSHILDPRDGRALPPRGSVTVVSSNAMEADVLSTALYVMGPRDGLVWADRHGVAAIFIVPSAAGWEVLRSEKINESGLAVRAASAEFQTEGNTR